MANPESKKLAIDVIARVDKLEREMRKARRATNDNFTAMERSSQRAARNIETNMARAGQRVAAAGKTFFNPLLLGATAALTPILSITAALGTAKAAMQEFSKTGDVAARLGVDVERLQELRYAAEQGGMAVDNFDVAFRRFIRRSAEAAQGTGAAKDAFKELGISVRDSDGSLKASDKLLGEVADRLQKVKDPADKLRLAFKMFDTDGAAMVNVLANGSKGLDDFSAKARALGIVVDRDMIGRAQELSAEFETATRIMDLQFKQALVNLAPIMVGIAERAARLAGDIRSLIDSMRDLENQGSQSLDGRMRSLGMERLEIERKIADIREDQRNNFSATAAVENRIAEGTIKALQDRMAAIAAEEAKIIKILEGRKPAAIAPIPEGEAIDMSGGRAGGRDKAAEAALREAEAVKELIAQLEFERDQIGLTDLEKKTNEALRRAGAAATVEEREQIKALVTQIEQETEALEKNKKAQEERTQAIESMFNMGADALTSIADGSLKAEEAIKKLAVQLALAAAQAALLGSGPLAGLFGGGGLLKSAPSILNSGGGFAGMIGYANGGYTGAGGNNQPAGVVHRGEVVWSQKDVARAGGVAAVEALRRGLSGYANGGPVNVQAPVMPKLPRKQANSASQNVTIAIDVSGARGNAEIMDMVSAGVQQGLRQFDREVLPTRVNAIARDPHARG